MNVARGLVALALLVGMTEPVKAQEVQVKAQEVPAQQRPADAPQPGPEAPPPLVEEKPVGDVGTLVVLPANEDGQIAPNFRKVSDPPQPEKLVGGGQEGGDVVRSTDRNRAVETQIILGRHGQQTVTKKLSAPEDSGLQVNVAPLNQARRASTIAKKNLEAGTVVGNENRNNDSLLIVVNPPVKTTIKANDVIVQSKSKKSKACVQIGVVGKQTACADGAPR